MEKKQKILQPQYVQKFNCIGGVCEDNCCSSSWNVFIDKSTYRLYRDCPDHNLRQKMQKNVTRVRVNPRDDMYAKMKMEMDADNGCAFLDDEKFCSIQRSMGDKYLSDTCATYPRYYNSADGILEKSILLSCPEAARLALLNTGLMEFDMTEEDAHIRKSIANILDLDDAKKKHKPEQYFSEVRIFTISLLQNRCHPLWQRLIILGLFCNNLNHLIAENKANEILPLIKTYLENLKGSAFHEILESIPNRLDIQIEIIKELTVNRAIINNNTRFSECFNEAMLGINYSDTLPSEELIAQYALVYKNYYHPFASKHEYILENYLVNHVFATLFPFRSEKSVFDNYIMLIVHYAMLKTLLIGMAGFHKEKLNAGHMLKLVQSLTKVITHDPRYLKSIVDCLKSNNMDNMPYMSILIKN